MGSYTLIDQVLVGSDHRVGWPAVVAKLREGSSDNGRLLLDDFTERTFTYPNVRETHTRPWVGIYHHPPRMPVWMPPLALPQAYLQTPRFRASLPYLRGVITLCEYSAAWFREQLQLPTIALPYPIPDLGVTWKPTRSKNVWQFGWYLRNTRLLDQIYVPHPRLRPRFPAGPADQHDSRVVEHWKQRDRKTYEGVRVVDRLSNADYDAALRCDLAVVEYFDVGASTLILECLSAAMPIAVGYHPAIAEYLGEDYPFYANGPASYARLLNDENAIIDTHCYMRERRRTAGTLGSFMEQLRPFLDSLDD